MTDAPPEPDDTGALESDGPVPLRQRPWVKRVVMISVVLIVAGVGKAAGVWDEVSIDAIQAWTARAGWLAVPLYVLAFVGSNSLAVPGILFVAGGLVAFGPWLGVPVVLVGAACSGTFATWWMGKVGGRSKGPPASPIARRIQKRLHDRPILAVAALRLFTPLRPGAHMLLALAGVSSVQNFAGTLVGFAPRVVLVAIFLEPVVAWLTSE